MQKWLLLGLLFIGVSLISLSYFLPKLNEAKTLQFEQYDVPRTPIKQVFYLDDAVCFSYPNAVKELSEITLTNSNSMLPLIDSSSKIVLRKPTKEQIVVHSIISFKHPQSILPILHEVIYVGADEEGWFAITKGTNNKIDDNYKVRFSDVLGEVIVFAR